MYITSNTKGVEISGAHINFSSDPFHLEYNPVMAIVDKDTKFESGVHSGTCNYMLVGESSKEGITLIQFVEFNQMTGEHVDTARIVRDIELFNKDLNNLIKLLNDRLEKLQSQSPESTSNLRRGNVFQK